MLLVELMLINLTVWQYSRWQEKQAVTVQTAELVGVWNAAAGAWTWQGESVRILQQDNNPSVVVVGGGQSGEVGGILRSWMPQHGWLKGPIYNVNERALLRLDESIFKGYDIADMWLDARPNAPVTLDGIDAGRHLQYMLTWLILSIVLPVLLLCWWRQKK